MMTLAAEEFTGRFLLLHTLPDGFHRIRHYGFLDNGRRSDHLALCRRLLTIDNASALSKPANDPGKGDCPFAAIDFAICPKCGGTMHRIAAVPRYPNLNYSAVSRHDSPADANRNRDRAQCCRRCPQTRHASHDVDQCSCARRTRHCSRG
jgi:Putative transposase